MITISKERRIQELNLTKQEKVEGCLRKSMGILTVRGKLSHYHEPGIVASFQSKQINMSQHGSRRVVFINSAGPGRKNQGLHPFHHNAGAPYLKELEVNFDVGSRISKLRFS